MESPSARMRAGRSLRMFSGVSLPPAALARRPKMTLRHPAAKLLVDNGLDQRLEIRVAKFDTIIADPVDNSAHNRVGPAEVVMASCMIETRVKRQYVIIIVPVCDCLSYLR